MTDKTKDRQCVIAVTSSHMRVSLISVSLNQRKSKPHLPWVANCPNALDFSLYPVKPHPGDYLLHSHLCHGLDAARDRRTEQRPLPSPERLPFAIERDDADEPVLLEDDDSTQERRGRSGVPPPRQLPGGGAVRARPGDGQRVPLRDERRQPLHVV